MDTILGRRPVNAEPIKNVRVRATLAIFFAKTRMGWTCAAPRHSRAEGLSDGLLHPHTIVSMLINDLADIDNEVFLFLDDIIR